MSFNSLWSGPGFIPGLKRGTFKLWGSAEPTFCWGSDFWALVAFPCVIATHGGLNQGNLAVNKKNKHKNSRAHYPDSDILHRRKGQASLPTRRDIAQNSPRDAYELVRNAPQLVFRLHLLSVGLVRHALLFRRSVPFAQAGGACANPPTKVYRVLPRKYQRIFPEQAWL